MSERRAFPRWPVALTCQTSTKTGCFPGRIREITENGLGLISAYDADVGERVTVAWRLGAGEEPLHVDCVVRDVNPRTIGVEFLNLTRTKRLRIAGFISERHRQFGA